MGFLSFVLSVFAATLSMFFLFQGLEGLQPFREVLHSDLRHHDQNNGFSGGLCADGIQLQYRPTQLDRG